MELVKFGVVLSESKQAVL